LKLNEHEKIIIVHFGELWLRGQNRNVYIKKLASNMREILYGEDIRIDRLYDRFLIRLGRDADLESIKKKLGYVFGISNFEIAYITKPEIKAICSLGEEMLEGLDGKIVKISSHRTYKELPFDSIEIMDKLATAAKKMGLSLSNKGFDVELRINVTKDAAFCSCEKTSAPGGLPVGSSGKGVVLLSGGIDSPVAAWYAMKRGVEPIYVHIHGYSSTDEALKSKIPEITKILDRYSPGSKTYYLPSHIFQLGAIKAGRYELILLKAFMLMIAEKIAEKEGAVMIFTGESLGQVASQTPSNLAAEQNGVEMPVLRPLIGFDKQEIIKMAKQIGTYELSILPYKDVCSINSKNPKTYTDIGRMKLLKKETKLKSIVSRTLKSGYISE
jgi:thiamine biosynthesis protein ThiI